MRVLVCGDRNWTDRGVIHRQLKKLPADTIIIEGEAEGADLIARSVAEELGFTVEPYPALWYVYGRGAGPVRNKQMLDKGKPDLVLAFHDNIEESRGTKDMVMQAAKRGIETIVINHKRREVSTHGKDGTGIQQPSQGCTSVEGEQAVDTVALRPAATV